MSAEVKVKHLNSKDAGFKETLLSSLSLPMADDEAIDAVVVKVLAQGRRTAMLQCSISQNNLID